MSRKLLIEQITQSKLNYIAESGTRDGKKYIGRLEGPAADLINPTRNDRKYTLKLWRNVERSSEFQEGMQTHTIFGEAGHPLDRLETEIKEIAVCLDKFEIRESEGIVWCAFDILDTPNGRIIKNLLDYGSKLGVSSRGSGDEIVENGECIIDPDTYVFICFDVVILPSVKSARPARVESYNIDDSQARKTLCESLETQIKESKTQGELELIKSVLESQNIPVTDSLKESLNKRLSEFGTGDEVSSDLLSELESATRQIETLTKLNNSLKKRISAGESRLSESKKIIVNMRNNSKKFKEALRLKNQEISELQESIQCNVEQYDDYTSRIEVLGERVERLKRINHTLTESVTTLKTDMEKLELLNSELNLKLESNNANSSKVKALFESRISKLSDEHKDNKEELKKLTESYKQQSSLNESLKKRNSELFSEYRSLICRSNGLDESDQRVRSCKSVKQLNETIAKIVDEKDRIGRLPINVGVGAPNLVTVIKESTEHVSDEDAQTYAILTGASKY